MGIVLSGSELGSVFEFGRDFSKYDIAVRLLYNLTALYFAVFKRYITFVFDRVT